MTDPRDRLARRMGLVEAYTDATGTRHETSAASRDAILAAMGAPMDADGAAAHLAALDAADADRPMPAFVIAPTDAPFDIDGLAGRDWELVLEDGTRQSGTGGSIESLPLGIHELRCAGTIGWILCAPPRLPEPPLSWGVTLPLYGLGAEGRIGTYGDLAAAIRSLGRAGAAFVGVNPIHAGFPGDPTAISPYSPSHRGRLATFHVDPGDEAAPDGEGDLIDWSAALPARMAALQSAWRERRDDDGFAEWRDAEGDDLHRFCLHQALADRHGSYWPRWPEAYRAPDTEEVRRFAEDNPEALDYHAWLQWRADAQLADVQAEAEAAGMAFGLYLDLAVGTHPAGAETWGDATLFAQGVSLGAPPDAFSADGQSWGLAPLRPDTLIAEGFRPLAAILRRQLSHARLLRIDHILGFERAFWVPNGDGVPGAYVRMPRDGLLAVARIEAARVGATIVGEDLGNIPDGLQHALEGSGVLGCRVVQFEQNWDIEPASFKRPKEYAVGALTSFSTHDLPTWLGWRAGRDIDWRYDLGSIDTETHRRSREHRQAEVKALDRQLEGSDADADAMHRFVASTRSRLVALQIEDILGRVEQPNLPGTVHDHPNWRRPVGVAPEALGELDAVARTAELMTDARR